MKKDTGRLYILLAIPFGFICECLYFYYQNTSNPNPLVALTIEIFGAFTATYLGVLWSIKASNNEESIKAAKAKEELITTSLILLYGELDPNRRIITNICEALKIMPHDDELESNFDMLVDYGNDIKSSVYNNLISIGGMHALIDNQDIFNSVQQAYNNVFFKLSALKAVHSTIKSEIMKSPPRYLYTSIDECYVSFTDVQKRLENAIKLIRVYLKYHGRTYHELSK